MDTLEYNRRNGLIFMVLFSFSLVCRKITNNYSVMVAPVVCIPQQVTISFHTANLANMHEMCRIFNSNDYSA